MPAETAEMHIIVQFPFRGFFGWYEKTALNLLGSENMVDYETLKSIGRALGTRAYQFDDAYKELTKFSTYKNGKYVYLTEEQKFSILNEIADTRTRNIAQHVPYDQNKNIVIDPFIKRVFSFPQQVTYEELVHKVYTETKATVFTYTVHKSEHPPILVQDADKVSAQYSAQIQTAKENERQAYLHTTQQVQLRVFFPYRALFRWDSYSRAVLDHPDKFIYWNQEQKRELREKLADIKQFRSARTIKEYDTVWWLLSEIKIRDRSGLTNPLTQEQKQDLITALTIPGTRGKEGNFSYVNRSQPAQGLIADPSMTQEITVPYRPDNNYLPTLQNMYGTKTTFWYEQI